MKIYFAGAETVQTKNVELLYGGQNLVSFYSMNKRGYQVMKNSKEFLLDSGAFSFFKKSADVNWEEYIERYAAFIKENSIRHFFELDIDPLVGYEKVKCFRDYLEKTVCHQCIPVWHKSRGLDEWGRLCDEYPYIAIGGIVTREIKPEEYGSFSALISTAHKKHTLVHGLGFTTTSLLKKYHFDSVDSTNWLFGKFGHYYEFTSDGNMKMHTRPRNRKCEDIAGLQAHNIREWVKFRKYASIHL